MPESVLTYRGIVYPWQCDHMGHMNAMHYAGRFDEASWQMLSMLGLSCSQLLGARCGMAAVEQNSRYLRELHAGDPITIRSEILDVTDKSVRLLHEMTNDERQELAATSEVVAVYFDATQRRSGPFPLDIQRRLSSAVERIAAEVILQASGILPASLPDATNRPAPASTAHRLK